MPRRRRRCKFPRPVRSRRVAGWQQQTIRSSTSNPNCSWRNSTLQNAPLERPPMDLSRIGEFVSEPSWCQCQWRRSVRSSTQLNTYIAAPFPAQMLIHVKPDQPVEMAFKSQPGRLFRGTVANVIQATGEGQIMTGGKLPSAASIGSPGYLAVKIRLDEDEPAELLEMGSAGVVAIYTDWGKPFAMISKVAVRMKKWIYFLPIPS